MLITNRSILIDLPQTSRFLVLGWTVCCCFFYVAIIWLLLILSKCCSFYCVINCLLLRETISHIIQYCYIDRFVFNVKHHCINIGFRVSTLFLIVFHFTMGFLVLCITCKVIFFYNWFFTKYFFQCIPCSIWSISFYNVMK